MAWSEWRKFGDTPCKLDDIVYVNLTGTSTHENYPMMVCYVYEDTICLIGTESLGTVTITTAKNSTWNAEFELNNKTYNISDVKIPTIEQILNKCCRPVQGTLTIPTSSQWKDDTSQAYCLFPDTYNVSVARIGNVSTGEKKTHVPFIEFNV